jgi:LEA14-like dessication related protein
MKARAALLAWIALLLVAGGCATLGGLKSPRVSVSRVAPLEMTLLEQKFLVQLRVQNPNDLELEVKGVTFDLDLNGKPFATGVSSQPVTIPRFGSSLVDLEVVSGLAGVLRQLKGMGGGAAPKFTYRLRGKLYLENPFSATLAFDEAGEIDLQGRTPRASTP